MKRFLVELLESLRMGMTQLVVHKSRSLLTALGVIIGVWAVILIGVAINGIDRGFAKSIDMVGSDIFHVQRFPWRDVGDDWMKYRNRPGIDADLVPEINRILRETPNSRLMAAVPMEHDKMEVEREDRKVEDVDIFGTNADWPTIATVGFLHGRFFTDAESAGGHNVVILGYGVATALFPEGQDRAINQSVMLKGRRYRVVGVLDEAGSFLGLQSWDNNAFMPVTSFRKISQPHPWWGDNSIRLRVKAGADRELARDELIVALRRVRGLLPEEENDFEINSADSLSNTFEPVKTGIALAGFIITWLSLFVGAVGIMNITFVSVKERTREIGTLRAIGARRISILVQFLTEATTVCLAGGAIGLALAAGCRVAVGHFLPNFPATLSPGLILLAVVVSVATGILSGFAPAWQASRLDPATALRYE